MLDKENVDDDLPKAGVQIYVLSLCFSPRRRKRQPTPVFCLGNPMDRGPWQATVHGVTRVGHDLRHHHHVLQPQKALSKCFWWPEEGGVTLGQRGLGRLTWKVEYKNSARLHFHLTGIIKPSALPNSAWQGYFCSAFLPPLLSFIIYLDATLSLPHFYFFFLLYFPWRERPTIVVLTGNFRNS